MDRPTFASVIHTPYSYKSIARTIKTTLQNSQYETIINNLKTQVNENICPFSLVQDPLNDELAIQNTIYLKQADYYSKSAIGSPPEVKPLLYYYAEVSLYSFFMNSLFEFPRNKGGHGLSMDWNNEHELCVKINNGGTFARINMIYSMLGLETKFCPVKLGSSRGWEPNDNLLKLNEDNILSYDEFTELENTLGNQPAGHYLDIYDFIWLFMASSYARYDPATWNRIVRGEKSSYIDHINKCFYRYQTLYYRLIDALFSLWYGNDATCLRGSDVIFKSTMNEFLSY